MNLLNGMTTQQSSSGARRAFINIFLSINPPVSQVNDNKSLVGKHLPEAVCFGLDLGIHKVWRKHIAFASPHIRCDNLGETNSAQALC